VPKHLEWFAKKKRLEFLLTMTFSAVAAVLLGQGAAWGMQGEGAFSFEALQANTARMVAVMLFAIGVSALA